MLYVDRQGLSALPKYPTMQKVYEESNTGYVTYCRRMLDISKFSADAQLSAYCRTIEKLYKAYVKQHGKHGCGFYGAEQEPCAEPDAAVPMSETE